MCVCVGGGGARARVVRKVGRSGKRAGLGREAGKKKGECKGGKCVRGNTGRVRPAERASECMAGGGGWVGG